MNCLSFAGWRLGLREVSSPAACTSILDSLNAHCACLHVPRTTWVDSPCPKVPISQRFACGGGRRPQQCQLSRRYRTSAIYERLLRQQTAICSSGGRGSGAWIISQLPADWRRRTREPLPHLHASADSNLLKETQVGGWEFWLQSSDLQVPQS